MSEICSTNSILFFSRKLKVNLFSVGNQSDFIVTKMSDQWQEFRCTCTGEEVGQNKLKFGQTILTSNSSQSVGGKYHRIAVQSSNYNKLQLRLVTNCAVILEG